MGNSIKKKVLGLDIGSNSIGFSLLELNDTDNQIIFNELVSNSIIFSEPNKAVDRRDARGLRRRNQRKGARNKNARKIFVDFDMVSLDFVQNPTKYLNYLNTNERDVYKIRERAVLGEKLSKDDFVIATYSILTHRGYNNMFSTSKEDGIINEAVSKNKQKYLKSSYQIPSQVLTQKREELEAEYQNIPIRNKKDSYSNSLDREMHKIEFEEVVLSQSSNEEIFLSTDEAKKFLENILNEEEVNTPFYQRALKSFEDMVEYCTFYNKYNQTAREKRIPLSNVKYIEFVIKQKIDNYEIIESKTGEIQKLSKEDIQKVLDFWIETPSSNEINANNLFKSAGYKNLKLSIPEKSSQVVLNITAHKNILEILKKYQIDFKNTHNQFYNELLLQLYYFKNKSSRVKYITKIIEKYRLNLSDDFLNEVASLENMDGFGSFSLRFINEVLEVMNTQNKKYHEALESLGYFSKYLDMPKYDYLPPLEPTNADIHWLQENIAYFDTKHLFYQPMISPKVKRVLGVLRKLINELIKKYGKIDQIRIETAKELNTDREKKSIDENQKKDKKKNDEAIKFLKSKNIKESLSNIERAKLFKEQSKDGCLCLYSGEIITEDEAFDENETEVEHFIPRSIIWINSYKNKILVKKKYNQNKGSQHPIQYLQSIGQWEKFCGRVTQSFMDFKKKDWLTKEDIINSVMQKEHWSDSFLNDTRTATKTIQKYLNHYLYPKENLYGKDEKRSILSVSGKAINELKYMWGITEVMPKNEDGKKDRDTNYHHTLDAFMVALCGSGAINTLHNYFIKKENKFKTKAQKEKLTSNIPLSNDGKNIIEHLKNLVEKYETNKLYVCPYNKRKTNMKGFKDGNLNLYIAKDSKDETKEILAEIEKVAIDTGILIKTVGGFPKPRSDEEVLKEIETIQNRLNPQKQQKIIKALKIYVDELLSLRNQGLELDSQIKELDGELKQSKSKEEQNTSLKEEIENLKKQRQTLSKNMEELRCSFEVKNGKKQIVRSLKLYKTKLEKTSADVIIFPQRKEKKIERLSIENFKKAIEEKEPFVTKMNETTLCVELFNTEKRGQAVGLNYFSSIKNDISTKINDRYSNEIDKDSRSALTLYKNEIIKVVNVKNMTQEYFVFNGGGDVTGTNNKLVIKNINNNSFPKEDKKGEIKYTKENKVSPSDKIIISKVEIDFFGNITEV